MTKKKIAKTVFVNPVYKDRATVIHTGEDSGGDYSLGLLEVSPGGGNPMHTHPNFEETFTAQEGVLGINLNGEKHYLVPGQSITVPRNTPHHFFNNSSQKISCYVKFVPAQPDFIKGLAIAYGLASDGLTDKKGLPKKLKHAAIVVTLTDTNFTGFMRLLLPWLRMLARKAHKDGTVQSLLEKYYYSS